jgi:hypothetical protein
MGIQSVVGSKPPIAVADGRRKNFSLRNKRLEVRLQMAAMRRVILVSAVAGSTVFAGMNNRIRQTGDGLALVKPQHTRQRDVVHQKAAKNQQN